MIAAGFSAVLCVAVCVLWARSYWWAEARGVMKEKRSAECGVAAGRLRIGWGTSLEEGGTWGPRLRFARSTYPATEDPPNARRPATLRNLGFAVEHVVRPRNNEHWMVIVPMWLPVALLATAAVLSRRADHRALRADRRARGLCPACGYDLRASRDRCPECGAEPAMGRPADPFLAAPIGVPSHTDRRS